MILCFAFFRSIIKGIIESFKGFNETDTSGSKNVKSDESTMINDSLSLKKSELVLPNKNGQVLFDCLFLENIKLPQKVEEIDTK